MAGATLSTGAAALLDKATAQVPGRHAGLRDIEHVVFLMQENRSFDHYYGTMSGVRGFSDPSAIPGVFDQAGYRPGKGVDPTGHLQPFHLLQHPPAENGQTTNDITHNWAPQHQSWHGGAMDAFVKAHLAVDGVNNGLTTMGYFDRSDLAFYYALADAFTICDGYHCSVFGPTDPNRVVSVSGTIDPAGRNGGPVVETLVAPPAWGEYLVSQVLSTLVSKPEVWAKTALFIMYDEKKGSTRVCVGERLFRTGCG